MMMKNFWKGKEFVFYPWLLFGGAQRIFKKYQLFIGFTAGLNMGNYEKS